MRAAEAAAQYTHPKLAAVITTDMSAQDFGDRLEAARKRVIEGIPPKSSDAPMVVPKASPRPGLPKKGKTHHWLATQRPQP